MTDLAHVQTKAVVPLAESRNLSLVTIHNPTSEPISNYKTAIDPALIAGKVLPVDQRILELSGEPVPVWQSNYGTGVSKAEIFHKSSILSDGIQQVFIGDGPWVNDLGPVVDIPQPPDELNIPELIDIWDNWHKDVVTDLTANDVLMLADMTYPSVPYFTDYLTMYRSQSSLFPLSARHVVKTSDGVLHAVVAYAISGLSRIVYMKSENGGETWSSSIVDNNDGHHYVTPSITCDKNNGIHITYTRWDSTGVSTYWLFAGSSVPSGFTLVSGSGDVGYHRLLGGEDGMYYPTLGVDPDIYNEHGHTIHVSGGAVDTTTNPLMLAEPVSTFPAVYTGFHHTTVSWSSPVLQSLLPPSRSLKLLRYRGIPPSLPSDIIVPFDTSVPSGFTRYSAQDGYCVYCSDDVGTILGLDTHRHSRTLSISGITSIYSVESYPDEVPTISDHTHTCDVNSGYTAANPYRHRVIFGKVDSSVTTLAAHALLMTGQSDLAIPNTTLLSGAGGALNQRYLVGGSSYDDLGGALEHGHSDYNGGTFGPTPAGRSWNAAGPLTFARYDHSHIIHAWWDNVSNYGSRIMPCIYHVDSNIDMSTYGNDLFYRYISPEGTPSTPVNVSELHTYFPSFEGVCLADGSDNLHFCWSAQGLNTNPDRSRISYRKMTGGSLGARTDLTTADQHMLYPSMDIDKNGVIHVAWFNATTMASIEYRQFASGVWSAIETVDNSNYVGYPSNIVADENGDVLLTYLKWSDNVTPIQDVMYRRRSSGSWGSSYNLSPGKAAGGHHQFTSQIYIDNKKNIVVIWNGKGYGSHTGVYHPVYRIILPDDTVYPPLTGDATDLFPDDDNPIIYPVVFWHSFPLSDSVYQNLVSSGFTFVYLYNPRGTYGETADLRFFSSPTAMVGDVGSIGGGGIGSDDHFPGGVGGESVFEQESYSISVRGYLCKSYSTSPIGRYLG